MKPRLLLLGPLPPPNGGIATATQALLDSSLSERFELRHLRNSTTRPVNEKGRMDLENLTSFISQVAGALRELVRFRPHIVQIETSGQTSFVKNSIFVLLAAARGAAPAVSIHSARTGEPLGELHERGGLVRRYVGFVLRRCAVVRVLHPDWAPAFAETWGLRPTRVHGIENALDLAALPPADPEPDRERPQILFLGWVSRPKGIFDLLEAMAGLRAAHPEATLRVIGPEGEPGAIAEVHREIARLGLGDRVVVENEQPRREALKAYPACDIYALPSHTEGLPMGILEAMACGAPIVATDVGAISRVVEDGANGFIVPAHDIETLRERLCRLLDDPDLRREIGQRNAGKIRERYSLENQVEAFMAAYEPLLAGKEAK